MKFTHAITRIPSPDMVHGLTTANLGRVDFDLALVQHDAYVNALSALGLTVTNLPPLPAHCDATFVEDTALVTPACAIVTRPGAPSRRGETGSIKTALSHHFDVVEVVTEGTIDAGDIMTVGERHYIGLSSRTNEAGANAMIRILERYGMQGTTVSMAGMLHLKTGVNYLAGNDLIMTRAFAEAAQFSGFNHIKVPDDEGYAANALWVNGTVLVASGYPRTLEKIQAAGYATVSLDVSEFCKLDGGLSCLSLRF